MKRRPKIESVTTVASGRLFDIERVQLAFSEQRVEFERIASKRVYGAVFIIATTDKHLVLIREYMTGTERYELSLPRGGIDAGESPIEAAARELIEETGYRAQSFSQGRKVYANSAYGTSHSTYIRAQQLSEGVAHGGDEIEPLEVVLWPLERLNELVNHDEMLDARNLLGIHILLEELK